MEKLTWKDDEFKGIKIVKMHETSEIKEIRISLEKDTTMKEHKAPGAIMVQILQGKVDFGVNGKTISLDELDMVALDANVMHSLKALENSIVRLSLSKNDNISRVFKLVN